MDPIRGGVYRLEMDGSGMEMDGSDPPSNSKSLIYNKLPRHYDAGGVKLCSSAEIRVASF